MDKVSQLFPITLLGMYTILYLFIDFQTYYELYNNIVILVDTILFIGSIGFAIFFIRKWKTLAIVSIITVIVLNVLTELDDRLKLTYYYEIYEGAIIMAFTMMIAFSKTNK